MPTKNVVKDFEPISDRNRNIITMEWITEGVALMIFGTQVLVVTGIDSSADQSKGFYLVTSMGLYLLAVVSLFTGFRIAFVPFRLCPIIFSVSATLILIGAYA